MKKVTSLLLVVLVTAFTACQEDIMTSDFSDNSEMKISESTNESSSVRAKAPVSTWTKYLNASTNNWYYQLAAIPGSALTANGFTATNSKVSTYCKNKGCAAACIMSANSIIDGRTTSPVDATKFVSWCKQFGITTGSTKTVDVLRSILKSKYSSQTNELCTNTREDMKLYLKNAIKSNRPVICLVRYSAPNVKTTSSTGTNHWVLVVGLSLTASTASSGTGSTGSIIRYIDSGTSQLTNDCSIPHIKEINYTTFLDAMVAADANKDFNALRIR